MLSCQLSTLLEINTKIENIMRCLDIHFDVKREAIQENEVIHIIINNLSKTLEGLLQRDHRQELQESYAGQMYQNMQRQLQRQENLNRSLIKKELEFKEYQKCLFDELSDERKTVKQLQNQLNKANDKILVKDLEILQLNNQKRTAPKDSLKDKKSKELFMFETLVNEKKLIDPFKNLVKDAPVHTHQRRKSDELTKRPSTANTKKKQSIPKK